MGFLEGKVALVTGGNRGIGRGIVEALSAEGATVVLTARGAPAAEQAAREIGGHTLGFACDVRSQEQVERLFRRVDETSGGPDILVNNAGVGLFGPVADMDPEAWRTVIETNLNGPFYCCREAVPRMRKRGGGYIINISSLAGKNPIVNGAAYNASKFGLIGFSEALMQEVRHDGVRVSYIMPGSVATEFAHPAGGGEADWKVQPEDVAQLVLELLAMPPRTLPSRIEVRPSRPPRG